MKISIPCNNLALLAQAFTHKSYYVENKKESQGDNEKLEFLGDAVLDLIVSQLLLAKFPNDSEGDLSQRRSSLVNETVLASIAEETELATELKLGKGESSSGGAKKPKILSSLFEAVVGAVFLAEGYNTAIEFVEPLISGRLASLANVTLNPEDFKTKFQEWVQKNFKTTPVYVVVGENGKDHEKIFTVQVKVLDEVKGQGEGKSKKLAEQAAARVALGGIKNE